MGVFERKHSALEHAKSDAHKAAFQMRLRAEGYDASERSEQSLTEVRQNKQFSLLEGEIGQEDKKEMTLKKFEVA